MSHNYERSTELIRKTISADTSDGRGSLFGYTRPTPLSEAETGSDRFNMKDSKCVIKCELRVSPCDANMVKKLSGNLWVRLSDDYTPEPVSNSSFTSKLTWDRPAGAMDDKRGYGILTHRGDGIWSATATLQGLPAVKDGAWGRVPDGMSDLLYGRRSAVFLVYDGTLWSNMHASYEIFYGDNIKVNTEKCVDSVNNYFTFSKSWIHNDQYREFREMYEKMLCSTERFEFNTERKAIENFYMRMASARYMKAMNEKKLDAGYSGSTLNPPVPPRLGATYYNTDLSKWVLGNDWIPLFPKDRWCWAFKQIGASPYQSLATESIFPFRGECAGGLHIAILLSAARTIGQARFDILHPRYSIKLGDWRYSDAVMKHLYSATDKRTIIPGDYVYMKNFNYGNLVDDVANKEKTKGKEYYWRGENALYYGIDNYMVVHFGGLGLNNLTEDEMREELKAAYLREAVPLGGELTPDKIKQQITFTNIDRIAVGD